MKRPIQGFEKYEITPYGEIWSNISHKWLTPQNYSDGYVRFNLGRLGRMKSLHRLLLETFVGPCPEGMVACHYNGIRDDNRLENLRWDTMSNNYKDALRHGTATIGQKNGSSKLTNQTVKRIINMCKLKLFSNRTISKFYKVSPTAINNIAANKTWKHIRRG